MTPESAPIALAIPHEVPVYKLTRLIGVVLLSLPALGFAETATEPHPMDLTCHWSGYFSLLIIVLAYLTAMLEDQTYLRKFRPTLQGSMRIWFVRVFYDRQQGDVRLAAEGFSWRPYPGECA